MRGAPIISASVLGADLANLGEAVANAEQAGCDEIHFDVMDGHFVRNISMGLPILRAIRGFSALPFEAHMMVSEPLKFIDDFAGSGCDIYTVHYETCGADAPRVAEAIRKAGMRAGLAVNPETDAALVGDFLGDFERLLVMTVNPGAAGQAFISEMMPKLEFLGDLARQKGLDAVHLAVDGGINLETAQIARTAGANLFVAATGLYRHTNGMATAVAELRQALGN